MKTTMTCIMGILLIASFLFLFKDYFGKSSNFNSSKQEILSLIQKQNHKALQAVFTERIKEEGAEKAYFNTKKDITSQSIGTRRHTLTIFGLALYRSKGVAALSVCDDDAKYGCFQGVFYFLIQDKGVEAVKLAGFYCDKYKKKHDMGLSCQHGIGRAIQNYLGPDKLATSLEECTKLSWNAYLFGCRDGVFIEFLSPTDIGIKQVKRLSFDAKNPYFPCLTVDSKFQRSCFYMLPNWWLNNLGMDSKQIGDLCVDIENREMQAMCFIGYGRLLPEVKGYDIDDVSVDCNKMPTNKDVVICLSAAHLKTATTPEYSKEAFKICEGLDIGNKRKCLDSEGLEYDILYNSILDNIL